MLSSSEKKCCSQFRKPVLQFWSVSPTLLLFLKISLILFVAHVEVEAKGKRRKIQVRMGLEGDRLEV